MIILIIGIAIPTAPGFIGNWHYFCILGLGLFGIPKTDALTFAIIYHALSIGIVILLGLLFLPFNRFSVADLFLSIFHYPLLVFILFFFFSYPFLSVLLPCP